MVFFFLYACIFAQNRAQERKGNFINSFNRMKYLSNSNSSFNSIGKIQISMTDDIEVKYDKYLRSIFLRDANLLYSTELAIDDSIYKFTCLLPAKYTKEVFANHTIIFNPLLESDKSLAEFHKRSLASPLVPLSKWYFLYLSNSEVNYPS